MQDDCFRPCQRWKHRSSSKRAKDLRGVTSSICCFTALGAVVVPFNLPQFEIARDAWRRFGKGNHPAGLNFGDCCSYALSKTSDEPLLFKGNDFSQTDVAIVAV